jgi:hypothetical protein
MSQQSVLNVHLNEAISGVEELVSTRSHNCLGLDGGVESSGDFYLPTCSMSEIQRRCEKLLSCQDIRMRVLHSDGPLENTLDSSPRKARLPWARTDRLQQLHYHLPCLLCVFSNLGNLLFAHKANSQGTGPAFVAVGEPLSETV